ncbi:hypothetical protein NKR23_g428 [Pleurostoma richardsiae]|uniref:Uncharacterized protein n=1 Tax=Pleurostoma richardsiae TaxID=41990 RepID=A0AA38S840_9PEZI|nr:hypothetical protein NKR23_g428 [Pleurostoma richardsiae]
MSSPGASLKPAGEGTPVPDELKQVKPKKQDSLIATAKVDWLSGATFSIRVANIELLEGGRSKISLELHCSPTSRNRFTYALISCCVHSVNILDFQPRSLEDLPPPGHRGKQTFESSGTFEPEISAHDVSVKMGNMSSSATGESDGAFGLTGALLGDSACRWNIAENSFSKKRGIGNFHAFSIVVDGDNFFSIDVDVLAETSGARAGNLKVFETWQFWKDGEKGFNFLQTSARKAR